MTFQFPRFALAAVVFVMTAAAARAQRPVEPLTILDVPYLAQSEALCGGAAAAMVMRFWGETGVYAETFADLVDRAAGGIRGADLLDALAKRAWDVRSFRGDAPLVREQLAQRRPVVALIEDRPGSFHYVVVVAWANGNVIVHDPARAPFRVLDEAAFVRAWDVSDRWTMLVLPTAKRAPVDGARDVPMARADAPCGAMVDEGVRLAGGGDAAGARRVLETATEACPTASGPWRELAGLHALGGNWRDAAAAARRATALDANDQHAWRILATSLYLENDPIAALDAWNRIGEPIIDIVNIQGLARIRHDVASRMLGVERQTLLTSEGLARARRRIAELPAAQMARAGYRPDENGQVQVDVTVIERPLLPTSLPSIAAAGIRLLSHRELTVAVGTPTGGGEMWELSYRWWERRPRVALGFSSPSPFGGVWRVDAFDERQAYAQSTGTLDERRRGAFFSLHDWVTGSTRVDAGVGVDRWNRADTAGSIRGGIEHHAVGDAVVLSAHGGAWFGEMRTWTGSIALDWRSSTTREGSVWLARAGLDAAGDAAPFGLWHGAGTGQPEGALLRAHPILDSGIVDRAVFGRRLLHGGGEWRYWTQPRRKPLRLAPAIFVDIGRATKGAAFTDTRTHVDAGAGVRMAVPGAGVVRIDLARGLRDGRTALSIGWTR